MQQTLQAFCPTPPCAAPVNTARQAALVRLMNQEAQTLDIRHRRDVALLDVSFALLKNTNLLLHFQNTAKHGTQPWFASFGFSAADELPGPLDHSTTDVGAALEWSNPRGVVKVGWDGSWFRNDVSTLVWDNPIRATDFTYASAYSPGEGTSQGRMDLWPDTSMNMVSGTATYKLPARTRAYANLGFSASEQQRPAAAAHHQRGDPGHPAAARQTLTSRPRSPPRSWDTAGGPPTRCGSTSATSCTTGTTTRRTSTRRDGSTTFPVEEYVRFDQVVEEFIAGAGAEPFSYRRQYFDSDVSYSLLPFTALRVGFSRETDRRTFREFERTAENTVRGGPRHHRVELPAAARAVRLRQANRVGVRRGGVRMRSRRGLPSRGSSTSPTATGTGSRSSRPARRATSSP